MRAATIQPRLERGLADGEITGGGGNSGGGGNAGGAGFSGNGGVSIIVAAI